MLKQAYQLITIILYSVRPSLSSKMMLPVKNQSEERKCWLDTSTQMHTHTHTRTHRSMHTHRLISSLMFRVMWSSNGTYGGIVGFAEFEQLGWEL